MGDAFHLFAGGVKFNTAVIVDAGLERRHDAGFVVVAHCDDKRKTVFGGARRCFGR